MLILGMVRLEEIWVSGQTMILLVFVLSDVCKFRLDENLLWSMRLELRPVTEPPVFYFLLNSGCTVRNPRKFSFYFYNDAKLFLFVKSVR